MSAQWYVTACGCFLAVLLLLIGIAFWLTVAVAAGVALAVAILIVTGIVRGVRALKRASRDIDEATASANARAADACAMDALNRDYFALLDKEAGRG